MKAWIALLFCVCSFQNLAFAVPSGDGVRVQYGTTPVGTTNWVVVFQSTPLAATRVNIFDSSGQVMEIGTVCPTPSNPTPPANTETRQGFISPGGINQPLQIPMGCRVSIRAVSGAAITGEDDFNLIY